MLQGKKYQDQLLKANSVIEELSEKINSERRKFEELLNNKASDLQIGRQVKQEEIAKIMFICKKKIENAFEIKFEKLKILEKFLGKKITLLEEKMDKVVGMSSSASKRVIEEWRQNLIRQQFLNQLNIETQNMSKNVLKKSSDIDSSLHSVLSNLLKPLDFSLNLYRVDNANTQISTSMNISIEAQKNLKKKVSKAQESAEKAEEESQKLKKKLKNEITQNSHYASKVKEYELKLDKKQKELIEQMQDFSKTKIEKSKIEKKYFSLKETNKELQRQVDEYKLFIEEQKKELEGINIKLRASEKTKELHKIKLEDLEKNITFLTLSNKQHQETSSKQLEQLQNSLNLSVEYLKDIEKIEKKVKESSKKSVIFQDKFEEVSRKLRSITSVCQNVFEMIKRGCFTQIHQELAASRNEIKMIKSVQSDLLRQLSRAIQSYKSEKDKEMKKQTHIISQKDDQIYKMNQEIQREKNTFQLTISDCKTEIEKLSKDNLELKNSSNQLASTFQDDKKEIKTYYEQEIRDIKLKFLKILEQEKQAQRDSGKAVFNSFRGMIKNSIR